MDIKYSKVIDILWAKLYKVPLKLGKLVNNYKFLNFDSLLTLNDTTFKARIVLWKLVQDRYLNGEELIIKYPKEHTSYRRRTQTLIEAILFNGDIELISCANLEVYNESRT